MSLSVVECSPLPVIRSISLYCLLTHERINSLIFALASFRVNP